MLSIIIVDPENNTVLRGTFEPTKMKTKLSGRVIFKGALFLISREGELNIEEINRFYWTYTLTNMSGDITHYGEFSTSDIKGVSINYNFDVQSIEVR